MKNGHTFFRLGCQAKKVPAIIRPHNSKCHQPAQGNGQAVVARHTAQEPLARRFGAVERAEPVDGGVRPPHRGQLWGGAAGGPAVDRRRQPLIRPNWFGVRPCYTLHTESTPWSEPPRGGGNTDTRKVRYKKNTHKAQTNTPVVCNSCRSNVRCTIFCWRVREKNHLLQGKFSIRIKISMFCYKKKRQKR